MPRPRTDALTVVARRPGRPRKPDMVRLCVYVPRYLAAELRAEAQTSGMSLGTVIEHHAWAAKR